MNPAPLKGIAFDLYGTLLALDNPLLHREIPALFGVAGRRWLTFVRHTLLRTSFPDTAAMARTIAEQLGGPDLASRCEELLQREVTSARPLPGVGATLEFLARRGFRLGLISNLSSAHVAPLHTFGLAELFHAAVLSCRDGVAKPEADAYRLLCARLELPPEQVLMVGDSLANDVRAPAALGMPVARVGDGEGDGVLETAAALGWRRLTGSTPLAPLLATGTVVPLAAGEAVVTRLDPVGEEERGRYNLVCRVGFRPREPGASEFTLFAKRYLHPASARVEALGHRLQALCELPPCAAELHGDDEKILLASPAPGVPLAGVPLTVALAREIGRQFAFGYVFANADLRPRNMLVEVSSTPPRLTTIDLEHLFLNQAIDVGQLPEPFDPRTIDALGRGHLLGLVKRQVLSPRTLPRARAEFFDARAVAPVIREAFSEGFLAQYEILKARGRELLDLLEREAYTPPFLIVGTRSYRRALAAIDLEDLAERLAADGDSALAQLLASR